MHDFCEMVYETIAAVPKGKITTYKDIADCLGYPGYARQVAKCLSSLAKHPNKKQYRNLPWHRVIRSDMKIAFPLGSQPYNLQIKKLRADGVIPNTTKALSSSPSFSIKYRANFSNP
ncbi:MAG: cysteine methyltransferase [Candidatus Portiera sp.]|nr:cysteine methyltransferase [Portiera sp.]